MADRENRDAVAGLVKAPPRQAKALGPTRRFPNRARADRQVRRRARLDAAEPSSPRGENGARPMSEANDIMTIDVVSDVVCPWCYLGEKRLEAALAEAPVKRSPSAGGPISSTRRSRTAGSTAPNTWRRNSARAAGCSRSTTISPVSARTSAFGSRSTRSSAPPISSTPTDLFAGRTRRACKPRSSIVCSRPISSRDATSATAAF